MEKESTITVRTNAVRHRYELVDDDWVIGKAHWLHFEHNTVMERIFHHTTIKEEYGKQALPRC